MSTKKELVLKQTYENLDKLITSKESAMLPGFNKLRFMQNCMTVLQDTENIEKYQSLTIARTLLKGAFLGLDFFQKECYAIPYGDKLSFQTDYKGETKVAKKYSIRPIKDIYAKVVRACDEYSEEIVAGQQVVDFKPIPFNNGDIIGAFAVVLYKDGGMDYESMSKDEIEEIRANFSKVKNSLMWTKTPAEAYKKTVIRRLTKKIEKEFANIEQAQAYDDGSDFEFKVPIEEVVDPFVIDGEFTEKEVEENAQGEQIQIDGEELLQQ